jgi:hypothetical protein
VNYRYNKTSYYGGQRFVVGNFDGNIGKTVSGFAYAGNIWSKVVVTTPPAAKTYAFIHDVLYTPSVPADEFFGGTAVGLQLRLIRENGTAFTMEVANIIVTEAGAVTDGTNTIIAAGAAGRTVRISDDNFSDKDAADVKGVLLSRIVEYSGSNITILGAAKSILGVGALSAAFTIPGTGTTLPALGGVSGISNLTFNKATYFVFKTGTNAFASITNINANQTIVASSKVSVLYTDVFTGGSNDVLQMVVFYDQNSTSTPQAASDVLTGIIKTKGVVVWEDGTPYIYFDIYTDEGVKTIKVTDVSASALESTANTYYDAGRIIYSIGYTGDNTIKHNSNFEGSGFGGTAPVSGPIASATAGHRASVSVINNGLYEYIYGGAFFDGDTYEAATGGVAQLTLNSQLKVIKILADGTSTAGSAADLAAEKPRVRFGNDGVPGGSGGNQDTVLYRMVIVGAAAGPARADVIFLYENGISENVDLATLDAVALGTAETAITTAAGNKIKILGWLQTGLNYVTGEAVPAQEAAVAAAIETITGLTVLSAEYDESNTGEEWSVTLEGSWGLLTSTVTIDKANIVNSRILAADLGTVTDLGAVPSNGNAPHATLPAIAAGATGKTAASVGGGWTGLDLSDQFQTGTPAVYYITIAPTAGYTFSGSDLLGTITMASFSNGSPTIVGTMDGSNLRLTLTYDIG